MSQVVSLNESAAQEQKPSREPMKRENEHYLAFEVQFATMTSNEERLKLALEYMKSTLSQEGSPYFKGFWSVRKLCLPLFKEAISAGVRPSLWNDYVELTREGRRLKNIHDQESAYAVEQIEIAISSIEKEVDAFHQNPQEMLQKNEVSLPEKCQALEKKYKTYQTNQTRLVLLNLFASRIHALRKELIGTDMRVKHKNQFFERLSLLGDRVFPLRKDLIKEISYSFTQDVQSFSERYFSKENFSEEEVRRHVFFFREEIKSLQMAAKILTLNTQSFTTSREELSKCWDQLKGMEKELKREFAQVKQKSSANVEEVLAKIKAVQSSFSESIMTAVAALTELDGLLRSMRELDLTHHDVRLLKEEIRIAKVAPESKLKEEDDQRKQKEMEQEEKRKKSVEEFRMRIEGCKTEVPTIRVDQLEENFASLRQALPALVMPKRDRQILERSLKELRDLIEERKEQALLNLSDETKAVLDELKDVLEQKKQRKSEVKLQIEEYRKIMGGSSLDFEKAMEYGQLMTQEKGRLEKIDESIAEIEQKIASLKKKV